MKMTEKVQPAISSPRLTPPATNEKNSTGKRSLRAVLPVLLRLSIICAVLLLMLLMMMLISGCLPERTQISEQPYEQRITEEKLLITILVPPIRGLLLQVKIEGEDSYTVTTGRIVMVIRGFQNPLAWMR